jgi:hypothetical protein
VTGSGWRKERIGGIFGSDISAFSAAATEDEKDDKRRDDNYYQYFTLTEQYSQHNDFIFRFIPLILDLRIEYQYWAQVYL